MKKALQRSLRVGKRYISQPKNFYPQQMYHSPFHPSVSPGVSFRPVQFHTRSFHQSRYYKNESDNSNDNEEEQKKSPMQMVVASIITLDVLYLSYVYLFKREKKDSKKEECKKKKVVKNECELEKKKCNKKVCECDKKKDSKEEKKCNNKKKECEKREKKIVTKPSEMMVKITEAKDFVESKLGSFKPEIGLVLGSGLSFLADEIEDAIIIPFEDIPHFPKGSHEKDSKNLMVIVCGKLAGRKVITMKYRKHFYEGSDMKQVTFPIRLMKSLGVKNLFLSNAAGGVNEKYNVGDFMVLKDHVNFSGTNPLIGKNDESLGTRFPDCSNLYDKTIRSKIFQMEKEGKMDFLKEENIKLQEGVYQMNTGPTYETPAEIIMSRIIGVDAVGMSTVPEAIVASHSKMKVTAISLITNMAAGVLDQPLGHEEVVMIATKRKKTFAKLVKLILPIL